MKKLNKKEIKSYSSQILKTCKLWGYDGEDESFENFFDDEKVFYFIPCYKKGVESCVDDEELEEFIEEFGLIVDEIIREANDNNIKVEVSTEEIEKFVNDRDNWQKFKSLQNEKAKLSETLLSKNPKLALKIESSDKNEREKGA